MAAAAEEPKSDFWKELASWKTPERKEVSPAPKVGSKAPISDKIPLKDGKPTVILFLRHCGCPFAEKAFKKFVALSSECKDAKFIAVSNSDAESTERWIPQVGGAWGTDVVADSERDLYAQWGLGISSTWHVTSPWVFYSLYRLGKDEGVWNKPTESGSRWQTGGAFAVDKEGIVRWAHISSAADDIPDFKAAVTAAGVEGVKA